MASWGMIRAPRLTQGSGTIFWPPIKGLVHIDVLRLYQKYYRWLACLELLRPCSTVPRCRRGLAELVNTRLGATLSGCSAWCCGWRCFPGFSPGCQLRQCGYFVAVFLEVMPRLFQPVRLRDLLRSSLPRAGPTRRATQPSAIRRRLKDHVPSPELRAVLVYSQQ